MPQQKYDWDDLERRWISGVWRTLEEMAKDTGISVRMIQKYSANKKWRDKRQQLEDAANEEALRRMGKALGAKIAKANEDALKMAGILKRVGISRFINDKEEIIKDKIDTDAAAITAIRAGIAIEQAILKNQQIEGTPVGGESSINLFAIQQNNYSTGEFSDEQLAAIIADTDHRIGQIKPGPAPRTEKGRSKGTHGKAKSKRKPA